jgi:hypothetical protein
MDAAGFTLGTDTSAVSTLIIGGASTYRAKRPAASGRVLRRRKHGICNACILQFEANCAAHHRAGPVIL